MTIVITMAGMGTRFKNAGFQVPKYMIEVRNKSLFEWSMESLAGFNDDENLYIFVVRKADQASEFIEKACHQMGIDQIKVIEIENMTDGQATTAMLAAPYWDADSSLMIYNIDTYVEAGEMNENQLVGDGFIPCFKAMGDHWSFVETDEDGRAVQVREKQRISDNCTIGAYFFKTCRLYEELYNEYYLSDQNMEKGEKYVAPLYNHMIGKGQEVRISLVDYEKVHVLGTPEELKVFADEC
ncbi:MAG: hypothetical protein GX567_15985 [Clostridia bacterium]|nr:hypothetical protein [Clostridia bacterium]